MTVAAVQYEPLDGGISANVPGHVRHLVDAHSMGARLVLFPELSLTGYELELLAADGGDGAWLVPGDERLAPLREACSQTGTTAVVGAALRDNDGTPRLASVVIGPDGEEQPVFKTYLHGAERELFEPGDGPALLELDGWKIALAICFDAAVPAHAQAAADAGADIYAVSAVYVEGEEHRLGLHLGSRAMDHRMFGILANLGGETGIGSSCGLSGTWGPDGLAVSQTAGNGSAIALATLEPKALLTYR
ncbi:hydrolase [Arthrobacter sp. SW1]|nr:hydrolase [Arthrobacter sp. SW1]